MKIQIEDRYSSEVIFECEAKSLKECVERAIKKNANLGIANLGNANLGGTNLGNANLGGANLGGANLGGANLGNANLGSANLGGANLGNANLGNAGNLEPIHQSLLSLLQYQKHPIVAFKYLNANLQSPYQNFRYEIGKTYKFMLNDDVRFLCAEGGNVATLEWCLIQTEQDIDSHVYVEIEIPADAKKVIPYNSDGKFRVSEFTVVRKLTKKELKMAMKTLYPSKGKEKR